MERPLQRFARSFSGKRSRVFWRSLRKVRGARTSEVLHDMAYRCQQLEECIMALEERVASLERDQ